MPYEALILDIRDYIATLTLNRPDAYKAVNAHMAGECLEAITQVDEDPTVRCVVITGAGKAFCAGGDVKSFHDHLPEIGTHLKKLCYTSLNETLETQMANEAQNIAASGKTEDFREGIAAFMQKRAPTFQGR
jgi:enoyl-CoA hydratase/carnithine racemase